jgi:DNA-binding transcriptional ArsR family regulator
MFERTETLVYDEQTRTDRLRDLAAQDRDREAEEEQAKKNPPFVQLTKKKMPDLRRHLRANPLAVEIFLFIAQNMGKENILVCSIAVLMEETGKSRSTIQRAIKYLRDEEVITTVKFGSCTGYAIDGNYVWTTFNQPGRYAVFENARAIASRAENKTISRKLSTVFKNNKNEPPLPGFEEHLEPEE